MHAVVTRALRRCGRSARLLGPACLALLVSPSAHAARAQSGEQIDIFRTRWWNITNGLPQSTINDLLQIEDGALWIATFGGLLRFDGVAFHTYDLNTLPGLRSIRITALASDGSRGIWFATQGGEVFHLVDGRLTAAPPHNAGDDVLAVARAEDGSVWTQAVSGAVSRLAGDTWTQRVPPGRGGSYEGLCVDRDGTVCAAVDRELVRFAPSGAELSRLTAPSRIVALAPGTAGETWIGLADGPARVRGGAIERFTSVPPIQLPVTVLREDGRGNLWLGTTQGPARITIGPGAPPRLVINSAEQIPASLGLRSLLLDREGNLWFGTTDTGLFRLRQHTVETIAVLEGLGAVTALCSDGDGGAWTGHDCRGLLHVLEDGTQVEQVGLDGLVEGRPCIQALLHDRRGRTWIGIGDTWFRRQPDHGGAFEPVLGGRRFDPRVGPAIETSDGDVWLSTYAGELVRVGPEDDVLEEHTLPGDLHSLACAPDGALWVGGGGRVYRLAAGRVETFGQEHGVPPGAVRDLLCDAGGDVWIATYGGGLACLSNGRAHRISRDEGLPDSSLTRILDDGHGRLWLLSNRGLIVVEREDLARVIEGRRTRIEPVVIGPEAGMNESNFGAPAGFRAEDGRLWFGTIGGAVRVDAARFPFNRTPPRVSIDRIAADEQSLPLAGRVTVPAGTRRLLVEYTTFALTSPERARFRHKLEGFDEDWVEAGEDRRAAYTTLWPGNYVLRVLARNEDGVWSQQPASLAFVVLPSWWQTGWFAATALVLTALALICIHRLRVAVLGRRARVLLEATRARAEAEERESRLREELAHVARVATAGELATSLAHEVNQPLAAISANAQAGRRLLSRGDPGRAEVDEILGDITLEAQRASEVIRRLRGYLRKHTSERRALDLNQVVRDTLPLVRRELADNHVDLSLELAQDLRAVLADPVQVQQVLVNLVKNACEAMSNGTAERRIVLRTVVRAERTVLEVCDTGPGLAPEVEARLFEPFCTTKPEGMGLGLAICRSIVESHGGRLAAARNPAGGMTFQIDLPAGATPERTG